MAGFRAMVQTTCPDVPCPISIYPYMTYGGGGMRKNGPKSPDYVDQKFVNIWFGRFLHVA